jgi:hypothetical protein
MTKTAFSCTESGSSYSQHYGTVLTCFAVEEPLHFTLGLTGAMGAVEQRQHLSVTDYKSNLGQGLPGAITSKTT